MSFLLPFQRDFAAPGRQGKGARLVPVVLFLVGIPLFFILPFDLGHWSGKVFLSQSALLALGLCVLTMELFNRKARFRLELAAPVCLLFVFGVVSLLYTPYLHGSLSVIVWWLALCCLALTIARITHSGVLKYAIASAVVMAALFAAGSLLQYAGYLPKDHWANPIRLAGPFANSNLFAAFLIVHLFTASGLAVEARGLLKRLSWSFVTLVLAVPLILTVSRGGWLAAMAGGMLMAGFLGFRKASISATGRRSFVLILFLVLLIAAIGALTGFEQVKARLTGAGSYSMGHRARIWQDTVNTVFAQPYGYGPGMFRYVFPQHRTYPDRFMVNFAHSEVLETAVDLGIHGLLVGLALAGFMLLTMYRRSNGTTGGLQAGALAVCLSLFIMCLYDFPLHKPAVSFAFVWIFCSTARLQHLEKPSRQLRLSRWAIVVMIAASIAALIFTLSNLTASRIARQGTAMMKTGKWVDAIDTFGRAHSLSFGDFRYARAAGDAAIKRASIPIKHQPYFEKALSWYTTATKNNPKDAPSFLGIGVTAERLGRLAEAERGYGMTVQLDPQFGEYYEYLGVFLLKSGRIREGVEAFSRSYEFGLERVFPSFNLTDAIPRETEKEFDAILSLTEAGLLGKYGSLCSRYCDNLETPEQALAAGEKIEVSGQPDSISLFYKHASQRFPDSDAIRTRMEARNHP
ncbi:O-antigen ligase family protein [Acidobacteriota bacterium]